MRETLLTALILIASPFVHAGDPQGSARPCVSEPVGQRTYAAA
ncbi:hypothetical protein SAMN05444007_101375 [Cribrihabitans marinus]|uniref:Uncharacterized protein n=1 Tax=Cribrihabitans marinus TaxID=1227549 RepID=A0A1H6RDX7_9RHOB|nr:hypothetical protein [Cribrihabitans marinus]SEI49815.1 hypothetical protein SAMN05444007_101375 [Cribrihabitans marinus]